MSLFMIKPINRSLDTISKFVSDYFFIFIFHLQPLMLIK